jgi:hypothetical protein
MVGGRRTSFGGKLLESVIGALTLKGLVECPYREYKKHRGGLFDTPEQRLLISNYAYTTIFGTPGRREYYIITPEWTGELECKFQNGGGSVDEKILYVAETLRRGNEDHLVIVHGGEYWEDKRGKQVMDWAKREAKILQSEYGKELLVFNVPTFFRWANRTWP